MFNGNDVHNLADGWLELESDPGLFTLLLEVPLLITIAYLPYNFFISNFLRNYVFFSLYYELLN